MARKTRGRQKITMTKMENESNLQVTFSKRRSGLFKKASELSILCGAEVGIIVFSPGNKAFSFGHPSVDSIIDRFLTRNPPPTGGTQQLIEAHRNATVRELNMQITHVQNVLEVERQRGAALDQMRIASQNQRRWEAPIEELELEELEQLKAAMEELKINVAKQVDNLMQQQAANPLVFPAGPSSFGGGGSGGFIPFNAVPSSFGGGSGFPFPAGPSFFGGNDASGIGSSSVSGGNSGIGGGSSIGGVFPNVGGPSMGTFGSGGGPSMGTFGSGGSGFPFHAGLSSFGSGGTGVLPFLPGPSSLGGGGGPSSLVGGGDGSGSSGGIPGASSLGGGGGGIPGPISLGGGSGSGIGSSAGGSGNRTGRTGEGDGDGDGINPFDPRISNSSSSVSPYGFNQGNNRGFFQG